VFPFTPRRAPEYDWREHLRPFVIAFLILLAVGILAGFVIALAI
jgi:hypothetical protein